MSSTHGNAGNTTRASLRTGSRSTAPASQRQSSSSSGSSGPRRAASSASSAPLPSETLRLQFPHKLMSMMDDPVSAGIIQWTADGLELFVPDQARFSSVILKRYCRSDRVDTFIRNLNLYGMYFFV